MKANVRQIDLPREKRIVCISDIHGSLDLFVRLLNKVNYTDDDMLILLGDLYTKGTQCHETFRFVMKLSDNPNVHVLRGNCDWEEDYLSEAERQWLNGLPHILESQDYLFVHGGLTSSNLDEQEAGSCMKNDAFMEKGLTFGKYVVVGHWPVNNYTHKIPCYNPIVNTARRTISIDGGNVINETGQLNAFMITGDRFSHDYVDNLPTVEAEKAQPESGGTLNITFLDRFIEIVEPGDELSLCRHIQSGKTLPLPNNSIWTDSGGNLCESTFGTDYRLPVKAGDTVSIVRRFGHTVFAKKNGIVGWLEL